LTRERAPAAQPEPLAVEINEAARLLSVSRSQVYVWLEAGQLRSIKAGRRRLVPMDALRELLARLEAAATLDSAA
jgi:excisionase family DNA binding protein